LDQWLWGEFRKPSAIFEVADADWPSRDVQANHHLARRLSYIDFPNTDFKLIGRETNGWDQLLLGGPHESICLLGRLGLYQKDVVKRLECPDMLFDFPTQYRPADLPPGKLRRNYHRIRRKASSGNGKSRSYYTTENEGVRTDYGLIQRYTVFSGSHWMTVLLCAGGSFLGTWGAAQWVARDMSLPQDRVTGAAIQAPREITSNSRMEALVRITADTRRRSWDLSNIELIHLSVDDLVWSPDDLQWHSDSLPQLTLVLKDQKPDSLWLNREREKFRPSHNKSFRLAGWTLWEAASREGPVPVEALAKNKKIWGRIPVSTTDAKRSLYQLKARHLGERLNIGDEVEVDAEITLEHH